MKHPDCALVLTGRKRRSVVALVLYFGLAGTLVPPARAAEPASPAPPAKAQGPVLEIKELTQDAGTVEEGTIAKFHFTVANHGTTDLEIPEVKPGCGCTVAKWDKLILPGKEGVIEAEINTLRFRGAISKHLTVISNDPGRPKLELSLTAKVNPLIEVKPALVALLTVEDKPVSQEFTLERAGGRPMKVLEVSPSQPYLKTEVTPLPGEGRYKLTVTATPDAPLGRTSLPLLVQTDVPKLVNLSLVLLLNHGIVTNPPGLYLGLTDKKTEMPQQIAMVVISREKGPFHVTRASVDDPQLQAKLETVKDGHEYRLRLNYAGGWDIGQMQKTLTVTTDDPKQPEIRVPIVATIRKPETQAAAAAAH